MRNCCAVLATLMMMVSVAAHANPTPMIKLQGELTEGGFIVGNLQLTDAELDGTQVFLDEQPLPITPDGQVVFGFGRDAAGDYTLTITTPTSDKHEQQLTVSKRTYQIDRVDGVPQRTVTPDPEQVARAKEEAGQVWVARNTMSERTDFLHPVMQPATGRISGVYGSQRIFNGEPRNPHYGLDIANVTGSPVKAAWAGEVVLAHPDMFYSGGTLIIDHGYGITSTYIHLSELHVEVGDKVEQGDLVAAIGATGRVTGPHLDWRINWGQVRLDPALVLKHFAQTPKQ